MDSAAHQTDLIRDFRSHAAGVLLVDQTPYPVKFIIARSDWSVLFPIDPRLVDHPDADCVLCLPDDSFDISLKVSLLPTPINKEDREIDRDRHLAYHGSPDGGLWMDASVNYLQAAGGHVLDRDAFPEQAEFAKAEPRLCKLLNADRSMLREATRLLAGTKISEPLAVGVDSHGFDVRAQLGIIRVNFPSHCADAETAERVIRTLLASPAL